MELSTLREGLACGFPTKIPTSRSTRVPPGVKVPAMEAPGLITRSDRVERPDARMFLRELSWQGSLNSLFAMAESVEA